MATATATKKKVKRSEAQIRPITKSLVSFGIKSKGPMLQHKWSEKALQQMRDKHAGKKTKTREVRDPEREFKEATYRTPDGRYGIPGMALKAAIISAAHKDIGIEKTLVRKALFLVPPEGGDLLNPIMPIVCDEPTMREDPVRVVSSTDLRYRPQFNSWSCEVCFEVDKELLTTKDLLALVDRAGFGVGIGEWRPEKGGECGRFEVDRSVELVEVPVK